MDIAIPKEMMSDERRVGLAPSGVDWLARQGHRLYVESRAGDGAGFADADYEKAGAKIVFSHDEALRRAGLIVKVQPIAAKEAEALSAGQVIASFVELGLQTKERMQKLCAAGVTAFALESIEEPDGSRPLIQAMSEVTAGRIPIIAGRYMNSLTGGRGIVLGDVPGVPPATVVIVGAGTVGGGAARKLGALGARVTVLDVDIERLRRHLAHNPARPATLLATPYNLEAVLRNADIVVGAISTPGELVPKVISREHVKIMRSRSLIIDVSIDQGGCVETSRLTTLSSPTFVEEGIIHYCVPNIPSTVARSSSYAFTNAALPYVTEIARGQLDEALSKPGIAKGLYVRDGLATNDKLAKLFGLPTARA